jgi:hypothetical protein
MREGRRNLHMRSTLPRKGRRNLHVASATLEVVIFTSRGHPMYNNVKFGKITLRDLHVARCTLASTLARAEREPQKKKLTLGQWSQLGQKQ